jgi:hypothetical protein
MVFASGATLSKVTREKMLVLYPLPLDTPLRSPAGSHASPWPALPAFLLKGGGDCQALINWAVLLTWKEVQIQTPDHRVRCKCHVGFGVPSTTPCTSFPRPSRPQVPLYPEISMNLFWQKRAKTVSTYLVRQCYPAMHKSLVGLFWTEGALG